MNNGPKITEIIQEKAPILLRFLNKKFWEKSWNWETFSIVPTNLSINDLITELRKTRWMNESSINGRTRNYSTPLIAQRQPLDKRHCKPQFSSCAGQDTSPSFIMNTIRPPSLDSNMNSCPVCHATLSVQYCQKGRHTGCYFVVVRHLTVSFSWKTELCIVWFTQAKVLALLRARTGFKHKCLISSALYVDITGSWGITPPIYNDNSPGNPI